MIEKAKIECDYLVVGGGTAGCVMANRLSMSSSKRVIVVEAGEDMVPGSEADDVLDVVPRSYANPAYRWPNLGGYWLTAEPRRKAPVLQARVIGGGSTVMGMIALRGVPQDYDNWAEYAPGWGWSDVLPYFRRLENDLDFGADSQAHGDSGPTEIMRCPLDELPPLAHTAIQHASERGLPLVADLNSDFRDGIGSLPLFRSLARRASSAICYLSQEVRARSNIKIMGSSEVSALTFSGRRVTGAIVQGPDGELHIAARNVILSAGALLTPLLLLRNGVGPAEQLRRADHDVIVDLPGVGRNLQNHAALSAVAFVGAGARQRNPEANPRAACFRFSSNIGPDGTSDLMLGLGNRSSWHAVGERLANFGVILLAPYSRGHITLGPAPQADPVIEYNFLEDPRDMERLRIGLRFMATFMGSNAGLQAIQYPMLAQGLFGADPFLKRTALNRAMAAAIGKLMDVSPFIARHVVARAASTRWHPAFALDDELLEVVRRCLTGLAHHAGTCRMGRADDAHAVVDPFGRVRGLDGLYIADASVMPTIPRGNTNLPTLMLAEKLSDSFLRREG